MPQAPRTNNKATKIAWKILGVPAPLQKPKDRDSRKEEKIREQLIYEETSLVR